MLWPLLQVCVSGLIPKASQPCHQEYFPKLINGALIHTQVYAVFHLKHNLANFYKVIFVEFKIILLKSFNAVDKPFVCFFFFYLDNMYSFSYLHLAFDFHITRLVFSFDCYRAERVILQLCVFTSNLNNWKTIHRYFPKFALNFCLQLSRCAISICHFVMFSNIFNCILFYSCQYNLYVK